MTTRTRERARRRGFTLVELMIAMAAGTATIAAAYYLGSTSSRAFNHQMHATETQGALRAAMDQLQRDVARAGFLSTPYLGAEQNCLGIANTVSSLTNWNAEEVRGVRVVPNDVLAAAQAFLPSGARADGLWLFGNYDDGDVYKITGDDGGNPNALFFETGRESFRRSFFTGANSTFNQARFNQVFAPNSVVRIESNFSVFFRTVTSVGTDPALPSLVLDQPIPDACLRRSTALVTPLKFVRYGLEVLTGPAFARVTAASSVRAGTDRKVALVRREFDGLRQEITAAARVILDYAVEFQADRVVLAPTNTWLTLPVAQADDVDPQRLPRALRVTLSARAEDVESNTTRLADMRSTSGALMGFRLSNGATTDWARVRTLRQEVFLPNMLPGVRP